MSQKTRLSRPSETLRLIELTSDRLCRETGAREAAADAAVDARLPAWPRPVEAACEADAEALSITRLVSLAAGLPSGGEIILAGSADDLFLRTNGPGAAWPAGMDACVADAAAARAAIAADRGVQMPLTALLAHASGTRLSFLMASARQNGPPMLRLSSG